MSKGNNHGNAASSLKNTLDVKGLTPSVISYKESKVGSDKFDVGQEKKAVDAFEVFSGIINDSPEILLFSNFTPVYDDNESELNSVGKIFQAKQDSLLISANSSIKSVINSTSYQTLKTNVSRNKLDLFNFCSSFGDSIDSILKRFLLIKNKFDIRLPIDETTLKIINALPQSNDLLKKDILPTDFSPFKVEEILFNDADNIKNWTATKVWIQTCLELKEAFRNGLPMFMMSDVSSIPSFFNNVYKNPYSLFLPRSYSIKKFGFNQSQPVTISMQDFSNIMNESPGDNKKNKIEAILKIIRPLFDIKSVSLNVFNQDLFNENKKIDTSIAQLSYIICREYLYSTRLDKKVIEDYGYPIKIDGNGNFEIWDYLFGQAGEDITDIISNPLGGGKSLISLSQYYSEQDNAEILTFEDAYIKDNIGTKRPNATLTPGTQYYIESSLTLNSSNTFDTSRLNSYISRHKSALKMLEMLKNNLAFKSDIPVFTSEEKKSKNSINGASNNKNPLDSLLNKSQRTSSTSDISTGGRGSTDVNDFFSNPIVLVRYIEQKILSTSELNKKPTNKIFSDYLWSSENQPKDVSWILISAALDFQDKELLSLLFLYCVLSINDDKIKQDSSSLFGIPTSFQFRAEISTKIVGRLKELLKYESQNQNLPSSGELKSGFIEENIIVNALNGTASEANKILIDISNFLKESLNMIDKMENSSMTNYEKFFISQNKTVTIGSRSFQQDKKSLYSGVQKTTYISAMFDLCCLIVHASNPERMASFVEGAESEFTVSGSLFNSGPSAGFIISQIKDKNFEEILVKVENSLNDYNKNLIKTINRVYGFCFSLNKELEALKAALENSESPYVKFLVSANSLIQNPAVTNMLMSREQMLLIRSKMFDLLERSLPNYVSPIKSIDPYFVDLKNNNNAEDMLPIEDVHLASWNFFLKEFLSNSAFKESEGFNKKIMSVGLPQKLYRKLSRIDASNISLSESNKLIKINVYRINEMMPDLVYLPLSFLFDIEKYHTRQLKNYFDSEFVSFGSNRIIYENFPIISSARVFNESTTSNFSIKKISESFDESSLLSEENKKSLIQNHVTSFLLEEYLSYIAGVNFDEQKYYKYENIRMTVESEFNKFLKSSTGNLTTGISNPSIEDYFSIENFFSPIEALKKSFITPRKFDRVFHLIFDPDDFAVDKDLTDQKIWKNKYDFDEINRADRSRMSFDRYFVGIETFDAVDSKNQNVASLTGNLLLI